MKHFFVGHRSTCVYLTRCKSFALSIPTTFLQMDSPLVVVAICRCMIIQFLRSRLAEEMRKTSRALLYISSPKNVGRFSARSGVRPIRYGTTDDAQETHSTTLMASLYLSSQDSALGFVSKQQNWKFNHPLLGASLEEPVVDDAPWRLPGWTDRC